MADEIVFSYVGKSVFKEKGTWKNGCKTSSKYEEKSVFIQYRHWYIWKHSSPLIFAILWIFFCVIIITTIHSFLTVHLYIRTVRSVTIVTVLGFTPFKKVVWKTQETHIDVKICCGGECFGINKYISNSC